MTVISLPAQANHPGSPPEWLAHQTDQLPTSLRALCPGAEDPFLAVELLPQLCRQGLPEPVLEAALGWPLGCLAAWRRLPHDPTWAVSARHLADACAAASAEAEAELVAALHRRGRTDPKAAQWLLERRRPERWAPASEQVLTEARQRGADEERGRLLRQGWQPPAGSDSLRLPVRE